MITQVGAILLPSSVGEGTELSKAKRKRKKKREKKANRRARCAHVRLHVISFCVFFLSFRS